MKYHDACFNPIKNRQYYALMTRRYLKKIDKIYLVYFHNQRIFIRADERTGLQIEITHAKRFNSNINMANTECKANSMETIKFYLFYKSYFVYLKTRNSMSTSLQAFNPDQMFAGLMYLLNIFASMNIYL